MPIGNDFGDAYIEVHADTKSLRSELRAAATAAGKEFGKDWGEEADTSLGKEMTVLGRHIETALKKSGRQGGIEFADALEDGVKRRLRRFDEDIVEAALSGDWSRVMEGRFDDLGSAVEGVRERFAELAEESGLSKRAVQDLNGSFDAWAHKVKMDNAFQVLHDDALKMNAEFGRAADEARDVEAEFDRLHVAALKLNDTFDDGEQAQHEYALSLARVHASLLPVRKEMVNLTQATEDGHHILAELGDKVEDVGDGFVQVRRAVRDTRTEFSLLGRLAGGRNNFLNIIGVGARVLEKGLNVVVSGLEDMAGKFLGFVGKIVSGNDELTGSFATLRQGLGSMISAAGGLFANGPLAAAITVIAGLVLAITGLGVVSLVAVNAISGLVAIITALAASLSFALAGALLPVAPLLLALAAGIGAVVIAFKDLDGELDEATKPFKDFYDAVKEPVQDALFKNLARDMGAVKDVLNNFVGPLVIASADALSDAFSKFVEGLNDPDVKDALDLLGTKLPPILNDLASALGNFILGAVGFFAPISSWAGLLAQNVADAAQSFNDWSNSVAGENAIREFMSGAATSAQILWDLILAVGDALGTLFSQSKETGDGFLVKLTEIIGEFDRWANSPEGRDKIAEWMQFARDLADKLGESIEAVGSFIDRLDTPENQQSLLRIIEGFNILFGVVENVAAVGAAMWHAFETAGNAVGVAIGFVVQTAIDLWNWLGRVWDSIASGLGRASGYFTSLDRMIDGVVDSVKNLVSWIGRIKLPGGLGSVGGIFEGLKNAFTASGGVFSGAQSRIIGEAGPEAVVPLDRPLSMVDPSVRWLSSLAQNKSGGRMASGGIGGGSSLTIAPNAIVVQTAVADPAIVTSMVFDRLVAQAK